MQVAAVHRQQRAAAAPVRRTLRTARRRPVRVMAVAEPSASLNGAPAAPTAAAAGAPAAAPAASAAAPQAAGFTNTNDFVVEPEALAAFHETWREREAAMKKFAGFLGFKVVESGSSVVVSSSWASIPEWEAWSLSPEARRTHLPPGVWQHAPKKGAGFPEDFVPLLAYDEAINAKY